MQYCAYYQASVDRVGSGFLVSVLRSFEHLVFDRTLDKQANLFEFFVPEDLEEMFLEIMHHFQNKGIILALHKLPNRLSQSGEEV